MAVICTYQDYNSWNHGMLSESSSDCQDDQLQQLCQWQLVTDFHTEHVSPKPLPFYFQISIDFRRVACQDTLLVAQNVQHKPLVLPTRSINIFGRFCNFVTTMTLDVDLDAQFDNDGDNQI